MRILAGLALWLLFGAFTFHRTDFEAGGPPGQRLYDVTLVDLDGAKGLDIVASEYSRNSLIVLRNQGGGTFTAPVAWDACGNGNDGPWQIAAGEFSPTPDTNKDIAVACGKVTIVQGNGAGGFNAPQPTAYGARGGIAAGVNSGGKNELLFGGAAGANVDVLCMMIQPFSSPFVVCGNPTDPQPPLMASVQTGPKAGAPMPVVADMFRPVGEPRHDEVFGLSSTQQNAINIYTRAIGNGYQSWNTSTRTVSSGEPYFVDVGDVEGDGDQDVLVGHKGGNTFDLFLWGGPTGLATQPKVTNTLSFDNQAGALADFDRDGKLDVVIAGGQGTIMVHKGKGDGTFAAGQGFGVVGASSQIALAVGDLNGDARPDIGVTERHVMPATPDKITVLTSIPPVVTPPPPNGPGVPKVVAIKSTLVMKTKQLVVGKATNPPTASTVQKLVAHGKVLGRGRTTIAAGTTKRLTIKLKRRLKRSLRAKLTITATGPTGLEATVRKTVWLKRRKR
jgi:VCBS repeat protein